MILKKLGIFMASVLFATATMADTLEVNENHPTKYVVQKGDTLWDISGKFLKKPWYWPKIWNVNPQIDDPHWIYPGDVLTLVWIDGKPYLKRDASVQKGDPIPTINTEAIKTFLSHDLLLPYDQKELDKLPYVAGVNDTITLLSSTDKINIKGQLEQGKQYGIYHKGKVIINDKGEKVAYRAEFVGVAVGGEQQGKFNKSYLMKSVSATRPGDYLMPLNADTGYSLYFVPKAASVDTIVVSLPDSYNKLAGTYETVILGKGSKDGVSVGDVFSIMRPGVDMVGETADTNDYGLYSSAGKRLVAAKDNVLPDDLVGQAMVYRVFNEVSLAIIMKADTSVSAGYKAVKPE
jgi:hypothetical protein